MNGRDWIRRNSITSAGPAITPPQEASDFENVAIRRSTRSSTPSSSAVPAPRAPSTPSACASSTISRAPNRRHSSTISGSGATSPSIEKTPSTTTSTPPPSAAAFSSVRSSRSMRLWRNGRSLARERMQPSRIEAWSPESAITVSPGAEDRPERAEVGLVAGREHERRLGPQPLGELALELEVQVDRPVQEARAGQPGAVAVQRVERALLDPLVAGQPEVVVGAEHDPLPALHLHDGQRRSLEHAEVRQRIELPGGSQLLQALVLPRLGEDVDRGGHSLEGCIVTGIPAPPRRKMTERAVTMSRP